MRAPCDHQAHLEFHVGSIDEQEALVLDCFGSLARVCIAVRLQPLEHCFRFGLAVHAICAHLALPQNQRGMAHMLEHAGIPAHAVTNNQLRAQRNFAKIQVDTDMLACQ